jgi:hypothetical protein
MRVVDTLLGAFFTGAMSLIWICVLAIPFGDHIFSGPGAVALLMAGVALGCLTDKFLVAIAWLLGRAYGRWLTFAEWGGAVRWRISAMSLLPASWSVAGAWRFSGCMWEAERLARLDGRKPRSPLDSFAEGR